MSNYTLVERGVARPATPDEAAALARLEKIASVPATLTPRQLRQYLIESDLLAPVQAALAAISDPKERALALNWWEHADEILRAHPLVAQLGAAVGLSSEQIDAAFIAASQL